jgi:signal peptidase I
MNEPAWPLDGEIPQKKKSGRWAFILETLQTIVLAGLFYLAISLATARVVVEGPSMRPTLISGEWIVVSRLTYKLGSPRRGDVIVFLPPTNAQTDDLIKRVIGLPGETVEIRAGSVWIDGKALDESYAVGPTVPDNRWQLGAGQLFVMGDNRQLSLDSRSFGPISQRNVVGKAWVIYWPPEEWGPLEWRTQTRAAAARLTEMSFRYNRLSALCGLGIYIPTGTGSARRSCI